VCAGRVAPYAGRGHTSRPWWQVSVGGFRCWQVPSSGAREQAGGGCLRQRREREEAEWGAGGAGRSTMEPSLCYGVGEEEEGEAP